MLSTALFRDGDRVHRRQDLTLRQPYCMLYNGHPIRLTIERLNAMKGAEQWSDDRDLEISVFGSRIDYMCYEVAGWFLSDEMFVEGNRVMRHLT